MYMSHMNQAHVTVCWVHDTPPPHPYVGSGGIHEAAWECCGLLRRGAWCILTGLVPINPLDSFYPFLIPCRNATCVF